MALERPFFGRRDSLDLLRTALASPTDLGRGSYTVITGEPGIGKTTLVQEAVGGAPVVWGRATENAPVAGLLLWTQVLRATRRLGFEPRSDLIDRATLRSGAVGGSGQERYLRFDSVISELIRLTEERTGTPNAPPVVIALDDVQWADPDSLAVLELVVAELDNLPLAIVATVRDEGLDVVPRAHTTIELGGLSRDEIAALIETVARERPDDAVVVAASELTGGNPLFVAEVARLLASSGTALDAAAWSGVLPSGVRSVLDRRLARLPEATFDALRAASVIGSDIDVTVLASLLEIDRLDAYELLEPAVAAGLMTGLSDGRVSFAHALIRDSALAGLELARRQALHARAATTIEALAGEREAGEIALHHRAAGHRSAAATWAAVAGSQSSAAAMFAEAIRWYELALACIDEDDPERDTISLQLAEALSRAGRLDEARAAFIDLAAAARARDDAEMLGWAAMGVGAIGGGFEIRLLDAAQIALLEEALDRSGPEASVVRSRLMARLSVAATLSQDHEHRVALASSAVDQARELGDDPSLVIAMAAWCDAHAAPAHIDVRLAATEEMVAAATRSGDPELELLARRFRIVALMEQGSVTLATAEIEAFARLADALRQPAFRWYARLVEGMLALLHGDLEAAWDLAQQAVDDGSAADSANAQMLAKGGLQAVVLRERGDLDGFLTTIRAANAGRHEANRGHEFIYPLFLVGYGVDDTTVRKILDRMPSDLSWADDDSLYLFVWTMIGDSAAAVGDVAWADRAWSRLEPHADRFALDGTASVCYGPVAATLARLSAMEGKTVDAAGWYRRALDGLSGIPAPLLRARIEGELAAVEGAEGTRSVPLDSEPATATRAGGVYRFCRDGETWHLAFGESSSRHRDSKGLRDLHVLIARAGRDVHVLDLVATAEGDTTAVRPVDRELGEVLDATARTAYEARIRELTELIEEAEQNNDIGLAATLDGERAMLLEQLGAALGLSGRSRSQGGDVERARKAVGMRIRDAIARIDREQPDLAAHLRNSVRTGTYCSYRPELAPAWRLG